MLPIVLPKASIITTAGDEKRVAANALDTLLNAPAQPPPQGIVPGYARGEKNADEDFAATVAYRKTGVGVAVGQSFEQAALQYMLTLDLKYPERPNAASGYVSFRQWCVNAATVAIDNMAQDAPADGFGVHCYNKGMAVALPIKLGWVDRGAVVERAFAIIERAGRNSPENAKNSFRNGLGERVRSHNVLLQAIDKITREAAATSVTDERTAALAQNGFQTEMVASNCTGDMMEVALWHVAENREASNAEYDAMTAAGLWQPHGAGGVDANLWAQKMPLGGVGFGAAAVTSFDAEGLIDVPKLPEFQSCPALAELVCEAPTYGLDPTAAVSYAVGIIANLAGERFDVRKPKAPASVSVHLPMPVVVLNASGAGKSMLHDTVALGALFILRSRNAAVQLAAARFEHEYKAYVAACKKSNTHPKECKMLKPVRLFEGANVTPQAWQQILCANQPSTLCISDEVGTFFENGKGGMKNAMSDVLVMMYDGKAIKPYRVGNAQAQGKIVAQGAFETEARGIGRASLVGLTQLRKWKEEILGNGELRYLTNSGALARLFIVPAMTKLSIGERDRNTLVPGTGTDSPFKMWEACVTAFAWRCYAFIDRISEYGREVGEFRIAPVMRKLSMPWGGTVWDIEPMPVQVPNGCIDADAPPKVPPKVMLGGDAQRFLSLRLTETGNAWLVEQRASFSDLADRTSKRLTPACSTTCCVLLPPSTASTKRTNSSRSTGLRKRTAGRARSQSPTSCSKTRGTSCSTLCSHRSARAATAIASPARKPSLKQGRKISTARPKRARSQLRRRVSKASCCGGSRSWAALRPATCSASYPKSSNAITSRTPPQRAPHWTAWQSPAAL